MTREEAANILWWASKRHYPGEQMDITEYDIEAFNMAIAALRGPQPDPDTGLVPCGCGGKAGFHYSVMLRDSDCYVECGICGEHSKVALCEEKARDAWNTAMGWRASE